jgi:hypothetical protein
MSELLSVSRSLNSHDHYVLRKYIPEINHKLPDHLSLKWRKVGETALTLIERGEYERALSKPRGNLKGLQPEEVLAIVEESIRQMPGATRSLAAKTSGVGFIGQDRYVHVAYLLDEPGLADERNRLTDLIDELNGVNSRWRDFMPHVSIATVDRMEESLLVHYEAIRPAELSFQPIQARLS